MHVVQTNNFRNVYDKVKTLLERQARVVDSGTWQSVPTAGRPEMMTHEVEDVCIEFEMGTMDLAYHRLQIGPNLPWADHHFELDRVCGEPRNPGLTWREWPYALKADGFRGGDGQFNHSYAERYWPKFAGLGLPSNDGVPTPHEKAQARQGLCASCHPFPMEGIRYRYGDLDDVVSLLFKNPGTRGAYLPVCFPEDTGVVHGGRTPCTIGYLFRMREGKLSVSYDIRSCDFVRHFKDDVYLTVRLVLWVIERLREKEQQRAAAEDLTPVWRDVHPGRFVMHVGSLHVFTNDWRTLFPSEDMSQRLVPRNA